MAEFSAYHALGQDPGGHPNDPRYPSSPSQNAPPNLRPHVAPSPAGYQQASTPHAAFPQQPYSVSPQPNHSTQAMGYFPQQGNDAVGGLTAQMGNLGVSADTTGGGPTRSHRRKERHAYHDISQPSGPSQGMAPTSSQFPQGGQMNRGSGVPAMGQPAIPGSRPGSSQINSGDRLRSGEEAVATQGRVDPEQIPSVPRSRDAAAQYYLNNVYPTMEKHTPPVAAVPFVAHDQGNSSPKFARLTINNIPSTAESLNSTALPLGLVLQPLAPLQEGEQPIPVLDFGEAGPPRCRRCRTYINPFMMFRSGGNKLVCNMCNFPNDVPPEYFAPTDPSGIRVDRMQRPELMMGTVEYLVPKEYWAKEPVGLRWLF
jgi:protein transport protein SEC24